MLRQVEDGQDEVSLDGTTTVIEVADGQETHHRWTAGDFGLLPVGREALAAPDPAASADIIHTTNKLISVLTREHTSAKPCKHGRMPLGGIV